MNSALKTQQSLNLLLQASHTRTRSEFVTLCGHPLVKVYLDLVKVYRSGGCHGPCASWSAAVFLPSCIRYGHRSRSSKLDQL